MVENKKNISGEKPQSGNDSPLEDTDDDDMVELPDEE